MGKSMKGLSFFLTRVTCSMIMFDHYLTTQTRIIIRFALPAPDRELRLRGWQMAWYLQQNHWVNNLSRSKKVKTTHWIDEKAGCFYHMNTTRLENAASLYFLTYTIRIVKSLNEQRHKQADLNHIRTQMNQTRLDDPETFSRHSQGCVDNAASSTSTKLTNKKKTAKRNSWNSVFVLLRFLQLWPFDEMWRRWCCKNISFQPKRSE